MSDSIDSQIVEAIRSGDTQAFAKLVQKYQGAVHGYAYHLTQNATAAEEIAQETFLEAHLHLDSLRDPNKVGAWLRSMTYHHSMNWHRHHRETVPLMDVLPTDQPSITAALEARETQEALRSVLGELSEPNRVVITLKYMEGLRNNQIAEFLGLSQSAVDVRLHRALKQLQERMLRVLERSYKKLDADFADVVCRQVQAYRPLIGVGLNLASHATTSGCICTARLRQLAEQTDGVYSRISDYQDAVLYGLERLHEGSTHTAMQVTREMQQISCPGGFPWLSIGRIIHDGGEPDCSDLLVLAQSSHITVDASVAWLLRHDFDFEEITLPTPGYRYRIHHSDAVGHSLEGRSAELNQLQEAVQHVSVGGAAFLRIVGEAGIGKTRLVQALNQRQNTETLLWLQGKAVPDQPYHPIRSAIQSHFRFDSVEMLEAHLRSIDLEIALPFFADFLRLPMMSTDARFERLTAEQIHYRTLQYLRDWLVLLTDASPVIWVAEDIHWLDEASSQFLQYLCQTVENCPVLFLLTRRSGYEALAEASHGMALEQHIAERYPDYDNCLHLKPLSNESSGLLLGHWLGGHGLLPSDANRLLALAKGNPLHLREIAQFALQQPAQDSLPPSLELLILAHLDRMTPNQQSVLRYAAVLGNGVQSRSVQAAFPEVDVLDIVRQLVTIGWFESGESEGRCARWHHDLYRETIYQHIAPHARRQLHAEIADQLRTIPGISPDVLADHYAAAGRHDDATRCAYQAAKMYDAQWQFGRVQHYAKLALEHPNVLSQEQRFEICRLCAWAFIRTGHLLEAIPYWKLAKGWATANEQHIIAHAGLSHCYGGHVEDHQRASMPQAIHHRDQALRRIDETTDPDVIQWACQVCTYERHMPFPEVLRRILAIAREKEMPIVEIWATDALARAHSKGDNIAEALRFCEQASQLAEALGDDEILIGTELNWSWILRERRRYSEALPHLQKAVELLGDTHSPTQANVLVHIGLFYYEQEQWSPMLDACEGVVAQEGIVDLRHINAIALAGLVIGYSHRGDWDRAYHYFWRMLDRIRQQPFRSPMEIIEHAVAAICHGDKALDRWMWEGISETMERAQILITGLDERGITPEEIVQLELAHSILPPAYLQHALENPTADRDAVAMMHQLAWGLYSLDEHVGYWEYLVERFGRGPLSSVIQSALEHAEERERTVLEWLLATTREQDEHEEAGGHLARLGFIPEPCWVLTGPFEGARLSAAEEQRLLGTVQDSVEQEGASSVERWKVGRLNVKYPTFQHSNLSTSQPFEWCPADDFVDAYIDCRHIFQTGERVCGYAATVIESPTEQRVQFLIGYDDNTSVWLNGELRFETKGGSPVLIDDESFEGVLRAGGNVLVIRVANNQPGWGFILRVAELNHGTHGALGWHGRASVDSGIP